MVGHMRIKLSCYPTAATAPAELLKQSTATSHHECENGVAVASGRLRRARPRMAPFSSRSEVPTNNKAHRWGTANYRPRVQKHSGPLVATLPSRPHAKRCWRSEVILLNTCP